jgi:hypothetical protein
MTIRPFPLVDKSHEMTPHRYYYSLLDSYAEDAVMRLRHQEHLWNYPDGGRSPEAKARKDAKSAARRASKRNLEAKYGIGN